VHDRDRPLGGLAGGEEIEDRLPVRRFPVPGEQAQPRPAGPHDDIGAAVQEAPQRRRAGVAAVAHGDVARSERGTTEPLRAAAVGRFERAEAAGRRLAGRVQAPVRPLAAGPSDDAAVGDAEPPARPRSGRAPGALPAAVAARRTSAPATSPSQAAALRTRFIAAVSGRSARPPTPAQAAAPRRDSPPGP
jgi:hypothetical protein